MAPIQLSNFQPNSGVSNPTYNDNTNNTFQNERESREKRNENTKSLELVAQHTIQVLYQKKELVSKVYVSVCVFFVPLNVEMSNWKSLGFY